MKHSLLTVPLILLFCLSVCAQTVHELTDRKDIVFARNVKDYQMNNFDSLVFDVYYLNADFGGN